MPVLYRASFGYLLRHPWQLALALLGICVGVAVMVAVDLANASSRKAFLLSMDTLNGAATHQVVGGRAGIDERLYPTLRVRDGIRAIAPVVEGYIEYRDATLRVLGIDVFAEREMRSFTLPGALGTVVGDRNGEGSTVNAVRRILTEPGALWMSHRTAAALGLEPDQPIEIEAAGHTYPAVLAGLIGDRNLEGRLQNVVVTDISVAQEWLGRRGSLSRIDVRAAAGDGTLEDIRAALPDGVQLLSAAGRTRSVSEMSNAFMTNLAAMSLLALLVGVFLIYNSVGFAVLQRRRLIGVLRALGLTRGQSFSLILVEGLVLGVFGAILGVALGIWLGEHLLALVSRSVNDLYFRVSVTDVAIGPWSIAKGLVAGLGVTLVAAAVPALEAASYQPTLAMARSVLEHRAGRLVPLIAGAGLVSVVIAAVLLQASGESLVAGLTALFLLIVGLALCLPLGVRALARVAAPVASRLGGTTARLAVTGIAASLSRTGVAIVALSVAVSATVGVSIMVDSFRSSVTSWLGNSLQSDIYVAVPRGDFDPGLIEDLAALPSIDAYSTSRRAWHETASGRTRIIALRMAPGSYAGTRILAGDAATAWKQFDRAGAVIVSEPFAYRNDVQPGGSVTLETDRGTIEFPVAAVYQSYDANAGAVLMSRATYDRHWRDDGVDAIGLYLKDGARTDDVMVDLRSISAGRQSIVMRSNRELLAASLEIFDRTFIITDVLYWLATGVAIIGILGAMLALQLERARELAILRAVGMTPGQLGGMVTLQSGLVGLFAGVAAMPLGLLMARVLVDVINRRAFGWRMDVEVAPDVLLSALTLAVASALVAGLYPAWRAARASPAVAMREE